jgi:hypothetical protein
MLFDGLSTSVPRRAPPGASVARRRVGPPTLGRSGAQAVAAPRERHPRHLGEWPFERQQA